jgi:methylated-DNA-protein-cysteine methyltransferase-like protein
MWRALRERRPRPRGASFSADPTDASPDRTDPLPFHLQVKRVVSSIPRGQVLSYAQVALRSGKPGGARAVVRALHQISGAPWWRVIRSDGTMAPQIAPKQAPRLRSDGVQVRGLRVRPGRTRSAGRAIHRTRQRQPS